TSAGPQSRDGANRSALQPLRQPSRPRVRGRAAADASALLHQRRRDELSARADLAGFGRAAIENRLIPTVRFAEPVLDGPAGLAAVPGFEAARALVRRLRSAQH